LAFWRRAEAETCGNARDVLENREENKAIGSAHIDFGVRSANCDDEEEGMKARGGFIYKRLREYCYSASSERKLLCIS
jgi:hypothetical protein